MVRFMEMDETVTVSAVTSGFIISEPSNQT
jgi:hypothetical protein